MKPLAVKRNISGIVKSQRCAGFDSCGTGRTASTPIRLHAPKSGFLQPAKLKAAAQPSQATKSNTAGRTAAAICHPAAAAANPVRKQESAQPMQSPHTMILGKAESKAGMAKGPVTPRAQMSRWTHAAKPKSKLMP